jgi:hypothetical protein
MTSGSAVCDPVQRDDSLDCLDFNNLADLERWIIENVRAISRCRLSICLSFARIKTYELYKQVGIDSFSAYLRAKRVKIHYHTAHDYALIGEIYVKYRDVLQAINFTEYEGLRKLLLLEQGLEKAKGHEATVFNILKNSSYREFKRFVCGDRQSGRPDSTHRRKKLLSICNVMLSDECLILMPDRRELLWFDPQLDEFFESNELVHRFKRCIAEAVERFLAPYSSYALAEKPSPKASLIKQ